MKKDINQYFDTNKSYLTILFSKKQYRKMFIYIYEDYVLKWIFLILSYFFHFITKSKFTFNHKQYLYTKNYYNLTWGCERAVEISIAKKFLKPTKNILEVGNVLSHYFPLKWTVLDKFEIVPPIINQDIFDFHPSNKFNQIISVSTLEHIGIDDSVSNPILGIKAIEKLKTLLKLNGEMLITIPVGYNPILDKTFIKNHTFDHIYAMKRMTPWNTWKQVNPQSIIGAKYGRPYNNANAILIGYYKKI